MVPTPIPKWPCPFASAKVRMDFEHIPTEKDQENQREVHEVAVNVFCRMSGSEFSPQYDLSRLTDGKRTKFRIGPEGLVIRPAIIIAGHAEPARRPRGISRAAAENQASRRATIPALAPNQRGISKDLWRIERRCAGPARRLR